MENEEKLVVFDKFSNAVDANIIKTAIEASGIPAGVIEDSLSNAVWMAPVRVVVFARDLEEAIKAIYDGEMNYEDYQEDMSREQFENLQACNKAYGEVLLTVHPELGGKDYSDLYVEAKDALESADLDRLNKIKAALH